MQKTQEIPETILEQLMESRVNGFPFFNYTGIKGFVMFGEDTLMLKDIPKNPENVKRVHIIYDFGRDSYKIQIYKGDGGIPSGIYEDIYFDQLADLISREMGVQ